MKKVKMMIAILMVLFINFLMLSACDGIDSDKFEFKDYDDFKNSVKNYSMTINNNEQITTIKVCENGYLYDNGSTIYFYNAQEEKGYLIDKDSNTGVVNTYESGETLYDWETQGGMIDLLYSFQVLKLLMKKEGTGKVANRNCTIYSYNNDGNITKYWLDNELGICMKIESSETGTNLLVTDFSINSVTLANMIDISAYTIDDEAVPSKSVKSIAVNSTTVPIGKTTANFVLQDITITVLYDDDSQENKPLTESMLSSQHKANLNTAGTHTVTVSYGGKTANFTITLESAQTNLPILQSIDAFYSEIIFNFDTTANGFINNMVLNISSEQNDILNYYEESIQGRADIDMWSAPNLLRDASFKIKEHLEGNFEAEEIDFGDGIKKTPSCAQTAEGYAVNYIQNKGLYDYWFETQIKYDEETDSLRGEIYCGVNEQQELKYIIEYNKNTQGKYACVIHYPDDIVEGNSQSYSTLKLFFNSLSGRVSINRLQPEELAPSHLLYKKADNVDYADNGDVVISVDNSEVECTIDNLTSGFYNDFNYFFTTLESNRNNIHDSNSEEDKYINYGLDSEGFMFYFEYIYVSSYSLLDIIKTYDNKRQIRIEDGLELIINHTNDTYVVSYEDEYDEIIVTIKYGGNNSFSIQKELKGIIQTRLQWVKIDSAHFIELFLDDYGTYMQYKYAFDTSQDIMEFARIFEINEYINLDIYQATNLNVVSFAETDTYPYYNYYSYVNDTLSYECCDYE